MGDHSIGSGGAEPTPSSFRLGNRPCLTGVRALGIAGVLVYHSNFKTMPGLVGHAPDVLRAQRVPDHRHAGRRGGAERAGQPQGLLLTARRPTLPPLLLTIAAHGHLRIAS